MALRVYRQSDSTNAALRAHGCGPYTCINGLHRVSGGTWKPKGVAGTGSALVRVRRSGVTDAQFQARGMTSTEVFQALQIGTSKERLALPVKRYRGVDVDGVLLPKVRETGGWAACAVLYGVVQDAGKGIGQFRLGHWVLVGDPRNGTVAVADPLRRQEVRWDIDLLVRAMERFGDAPGPTDNSWGNGRGEAVLLYPWKTWRDGYADVKAQRDLARKQRDEALADLVECQAAGPGPDALKAARAGGIRDAAANAAATV